MIDVKNGTGQAGYFCSIKNQVWNQKKVYNLLLLLLQPHGLRYLSALLLFLLGLWNAEMELNEKGYYFTVLMFGLFSAISVQKAVRDQMEGIPVTNIYYGLAWFTTLLSIVLLTVGLWNADLVKSEKGFYAMAFVLSLFAAIAVQKNTRDIKASQSKEDPMKDSF